MGLLKNIFSKKDEPVKSYADFWKWFQQNEKSFYKTIKERKNIESDFFDKLSPQLNEVKDGFLYLAGMINDTAAELVITADGNVKNFVFVEELVNAAPPISGWQFTALKPSMDIENVAIDMGDYTFDSNTLLFYSNDYPDYPDEIDITVVYKDFNEKDKAEIINGVYIFLDNYLGEYNFATTIDNLTIIGKNEATKELIPISKLKDFLIWREKEFVEKYDGLLQNTDKANYSLMEAELENGSYLIAIINTDILNWENKASHPWIMTVELKYDGSKNNRMPDEQTIQLLEEIEDKLIEQLKDYDGYLNIGRQTADNMREIYFACKEFKKPSKVIDQLQSAYKNNLKIDYEIYKDKYWQCFERFNQN